MDRRRFLVTSGVAAGALVTPAIWRRAEAADQVITVRDPGGAYVEAFRDAFYAPFEKKTGIKVVAAASAHEPTSQIKAMVEAKTYTWDAALLSLAAHDQLLAQDLIEPLKIEGSAWDNLPTGYRTPHFAGVDVYSTLIAYRTDTVKNPPTSWKDFWDVKNFPGKRSLRANPFDTIEEALMADGVPTEQVYPCDFDRAFKSLDKIRSSVDVWWKSGAQSTQLLQSGEVDMIAAWNGAAQRVLDAGTPAKLVWNQNIAGVEGWCILKGTPKAAAVREFVAFSMQPEQQAIISKYMTYGPTNPKAYEHIDAKRATLLSTYPDYVKSSRLIDNAFWAKNKDVAIERFNTWLAN